LGTTATVWNYPQITVTDFIAGYIAQSGWASGWTITVLTSELGITNINTPAVRQYVNSATPAILNVASGVPTANIGNTQLNPFVDASGNLNLCYKDASGNVRTLLFAAPTAGSTRTI
jgi:hypothetical protein